VGVTGALIRVEKSFFQSHRDSEQTGQSLFHTVGAHLPVHLRRERKREREREREILGGIQLVKSAETIRRLHRYSPIRLNQAGRSTVISKSLAAHRVLSRSLTTISKRVIVRSPVMVDEYESLSANPSVKGK